MNPLEILLYLLGWLLYLGAVGLSLFLVALFIVWLVTPFRSKGANNDRKN